LRFLEWGTNIHSTTLKLHLAPDWVNFGPQQFGLYYGLSFAFDNINRNINRHNYTSSSQTKVMNMTSVVAFLNRIPMHVEDVYEERNVSIAKNLTLSAWLVSEHDVNEIRKDHLHEVRKSLKDYLSIFEKVRVERLQDHECKALSSKKTEYVSKS
jgi:hypothetical protein